MTLIINNISNIKKSVLSMSYIRDLNTFYLILSSTRLIVIYSFIKNEKKLNKELLKRLQFLLRAYFIFLIKLTFL